MAEAEIRKGVLDMSIYITGDTHGAIDIGKLSAKLWKEQKKLTRDDYLIITGDFGFPFSAGDVDEKGEPANGEYRYWLNWLKNKPFTILFVDGNHENHVFWDAQPVQEWHGGKVQIHPQADNIIHLMRGEIYEIEGKTFFAFGGAASHDIEPVYDDFGRCIWKGRKEGESYWQRENASSEEMERAVRNLDALQERGGYVDVIVTHTPPCSVVKRMRRKYSEDVTAEFLERIMQHYEYGVWVCGHIHLDAVAAKDKVAVVCKHIFSLEGITQLVAECFEEYMEGEIS